VWGYSCLVYWVEIPFDSTLPEMFRKALANETRGHWKEKTELEWIPVSSINTAIADFINSRGDVVKSLPLPEFNENAHGDTKDKRRRKSQNGDNGEKKLLRKHFVKLTVLAHEMGILEALEKGKPLPKTMTALGTTLPKVITEQIDTITTITTTTTATTTTATTTATTATTAAMTTTTTTTAMTTTTTTATTTESVDIY